MYVSTTTSDYRALGDVNKIVKMLCDNGFTAYDLGMTKDGVLGWEMLNSDDYKERAQQLRAYADGLGIVCNQTHAPFPTAKKGDDEYNRMMFPLLVRSIEISGILGATVCVIHPCNDWTAEENAERLYLPLAEHARKAGVKIGVENMWNWQGEYPSGKVMPAACSHQDDFKAHMDLLPEDVFVACLDIGHSEMMHEYGTNAVKMIETLGARMQSMHLHDVNFIKDNHEVPFTEKIDYKPIIEALKKIGYQGDITLEPCSFVPGYPVELYSACTQFMAAVANYFREKLLEK